MPASYFLGGVFMDDLIADVVSVMMQILIGFAPERVDSFEFQLAGYICACVLFIVTMIFIYRVCSSLVRFVSSWFGRR